MTSKLSSLICAFLVLSASAAAGQITTATPSPSSAPARVPIPDIPGKTFDLAWVGKIVRVADPQISPNGKSLVTVVTKPDYERDLNLSELALVDIASGKTRFLTHGRKTASLPRWSPDGDRVAFLAADGDKHNQIFVLEMAGGDALQLHRIRLHGEAIRNARRVGGDGAGAVDCARFRICPAAWLQPYTVRRRARGAFF